MDVPNCTQCHEKVDNDGLKCGGQCGKHFHYQCINLSKTKYKKLIFETGSWRCYNCSFGGSSNLIEREIKDSLQFIVHKLQVLEPIKNVVKNMEDRLKIVEENNVEMRRNVVPSDIKIPEVPLNIKINLDVQCRGQQVTKSNVVVSQGQSEATNHGNPEVQCPRNQQVSMDSWTLHPGQSASPASSYVTPEVKCPGHQQVFMDKRTLSQQQFPPTATNLNKPYLGHQQVITNSMSVSERQTTAPASSHVTPKEKCPGHQQVTMDSWTLNQGQSVPTALSNYSAEEKCPGHQQVAMDSRTLHQGQFSVNHNDPDISFIQNNVLLTNTGNNCNNSESQIENFSFKQSDLPLFNSTMQNVLVEDKSAQNLSNSMSKNDFQNQSELVYNADGIQFSDSNLIDQNADIIADFQNHSVENTNKELDKNASFVQNKDKNTEHSESVSFIQNSDFYQSHKNAEISEENCENNLKIDTTRNMSLAQNPLSLLGFKIDAKCEKNSLPSTSLQNSDSNLTENLKIDQQTQTVIATKAKGNQTNVIKTCEQKTQTYISCMKDKTFGNKQKQPEVKINENLQPVAKSSVQISDIPKLLAMPENSEIKKHMPLNWNRQNDKHGPGIFQFRLDASDPEYVMVVNTFENTVKDCKIDRIYRVENPHVYLMYLLKREELMLLNKNVENVELKLFHGTKNCNVEAIIKTNFNWRLCIKNRYGKGACFASNAAYAVNYTENSATDNNFMFLSRVLVAKLCDGESKLKIPVKNADCAISCDRNVFVKFDDNSFYPEYLIRFKKCGVEAKA